MAKAVKKKKSVAAKVSQKSIVKNKKIAFAAGMAYGLLALLVIGAAVFLLFASLTPKEDIVQNSQTPAVSTDTPTPPISPSSTGGNTNSGY